MVLPCARTYYIILSNPKSRNSAGTRTREQALPSENALARRLYGHKKYYIIRIPRTQSDQVIMILFLVHKYMDSVHITAIILYNIKKEHKRHHSKNVILC